MFDIELINVTKTYPGSNRPAVSNLSLQVEKGSIITLLGPSGCGKTTTLRLIAGFEKADSGQIRLGEQTVAAVDGTWIPPERRGVGMVFQDYALFPHLTVEKNIGFGLRNTRFKQERISEVIELVGLTEYEQSYPHKLSGGQQQRVALARALAPRPTVILLDEPFSNLDALLRKHMRQEIREILKKANTTAIFVTHDQQEAFELSDQIIVMNKGMLVQQGKPRDIYTQPANEFVADFLGKANILSGFIERDLSNSTEVTFKTEIVIKTEIGRIHCPKAAEFPLGSRVKVIIRPTGFINQPQGNLRGYLKKLLFKEEIMEGIVEVETTDQKTKELIVYFHPYDNVHCGDYVYLTILAGSVVILS